MEVDVGTGQTAGPRPMVEAIPNMSEGRRPEMVRAAADAVAAVRNVFLLDWSSDASHHRSVLTMAGAPEAIREAVLRLFEVAVPRIDLRRHRGAHPRIGAVDVVPFVPLGETPMEVCVTLARSTAALVAERHGIPVYLYETAATRPERRRLELIRRGQFEGLAARLADPQWQPDYGPSRPHPTAGATAMAARRPLVAFNVNLASTDLAAARQIARAVRTSGGGLPCVKALGLRLSATPDGRVQVSMNLTDYRRTPVSAAVARVTQEAERRGIAVSGAELVGLAPREALDGSAGGASVLDLVGADRTLEARLARHVEVSGPDRAGP